MTHSRYRLDQYFTMVGLWFKPGQTMEEGVTGTLSYIDNELKLELYGDLAHESEANYAGGGPTNEAYIFGFSQVGYSIILYKNHHTGFSSYDPGFSNAIYKPSEGLILPVDYAYLDYSVETLLSHLIADGWDNLPCSQLAFSFEGINEWMKTSILSYETDKLKRKTVIRSDLDRLKIDDYLIESQQIIYSNKVSSNFSPFSVTEEHRWEIKPFLLPSKPLSDMHFHADSFKNLIHLFIDAPTNYTFIDISIPIKTAFAPSITGHYFTSQFDNSEFEQEINIDYQMIRPAFRKLLSNWVNKQEKLEFIIDNYLNDFHSNIFSNTSLLNSIKNLEIYHRNFVDKSNEGPADQDLEAEKAKLLHYIEENIDERYQVRFERNIVYSPETTFSDRLAELFNLLPSRIKESFLHQYDGSLNASIRVFIRELIDTRNYLTHGDKSQEYPKRITARIDQMNTTQTINQILKYFIFKELGLSDEVIVEKLIEDRKVYEEWEAAGGKFIMNPFAGPIFTISPKVPFEL